MNALDAEEGERLTFGGGTVVIKLSSPSVTVREEVPPLLDTPLHVHAHEDELFQILAGDHVFTCGDAEFRVGPGAFLALPRGVSHAHRRVRAGEGRLLVLTIGGRLRRLLSRARRRRCCGDARPRRIRRGIGPIRHHLAELRILRPRERAFWIVPSKRRRRGRLTAPRVRSRRVQPAPTAPCP